MKTIHRRSMVSGALAIAGATTVSCATDGPGRMSHIEVKRRTLFSSQQKKLWCWAASISNLFAYSGYKVSQHEIVHTLFPAIWDNDDDVRGGQYCNLSSLVERTWRDESGKRFYPTVTAAYDETCSDGLAPSVSEVVDSIKGDRPCLIGTDAHAMLLVGVDYAEDYGGNVRLGNGVVWDPWPPGRYRTVHAGWGGEFTARRGGGRLLYLATAVIS